MSLMPPPSANRRDRERPRIKIAPQIHKARVASHVINAVGIGARDIRSGKVMPLHLLRMPHWQPLLSSSGVVPHQFLLFCIHGNDWRFLPQGTFDRAVDVTELRVPVRVIPTLFLLAVALEVVSHLMQELGNFHMTDLMLPFDEQIRQCPGALSCPAERRFRITACVRINQLFQRGNHLRITFGNLFPPAPGWRI